MIIPSIVRGPTRFVERLSANECPRVQWWALSLHRADRQVLSKTGRQDENGTFATRLPTPWVKVIEYLANRLGDEPLLTATYPEYLMEVKAAAEEIGVNSLVPSGARHLGASIEVGLGLRSLAEDQKKRDVGPVQGVSSATRSVENSTANGKDTRISSNGGISWHAKSVSALLCSKAHFLKKWRIAVWFARCFHGRIEWKAWLALFQAQAACFGDCCENLRYTRKHFGTLWRQWCSCKMLRAIWSVVFL